MNKYNGLLLLPNYDKLFDKGYISFENNGKIILSEKISIEEYQTLGISSGDSLYNVYDGNVYFLERHRSFYRDILY